MKKYTVFLYTILMAFSSAGASFALPVYYTFQGNISSITDTAGIAADSGLATGDAVSYVFLLDFDLQGTETTNNGTTNTLTDLYDSLNRIEQDYFYVDFISGSLIDERNGGSRNLALDIAEYNWGLENYFRGVGLTSYILGESRDEQTQITAPIPFASLIVGDAVLGIERAYDSNNQFTDIISQLTLTNISPTPAPAPVPEPTTVFLMSAGLVAIAGIRRKKLHK